VIFDMKNVQNRPNRKRVHAWLYPAYKWAGLPIRKIFRGSFEEKEASLNGVDLAEGEGISTKFVRGGTIIRKNPCTGSG